MLTVAQLDKNIPPSFMQPVSSLPRSQEPATVPCPEHLEFNPQSHNQFL
jgi:hypothetical protein